MVYMIKIESKSGICTNMLSVNVYTLFIGVNIDGLHQFELGCILLGLFWLFLFWFRNKRIHGISISKRTLIHSENGILMVEVT